MTRQKHVIDYYLNKPGRNGDKAVSPCFCNFSGAPEDEWAYHENVRLDILYGFERSLLFEGESLAAGVDEVGRGPAAGPVVAAAVVFDRFHFLPGLDDSKQVPEEIREHLFGSIIKCASAWAVGMAGPREIDEINIHNASLLAMQRAVVNLKIKPHFIIIDGRHKIPGIRYRQHPVIKGDSKVYSIAAASVVAKVTRDRIMSEYDEKFPGYNFSNHKGYCTPEHGRALERLGPCPIHRRCFAPVKRFYSQTEQLTLI